MSHDPIRSMAVASYDIHAPAAERFDQLERRARTAVAASQYASLVAIYSWFGGMKFTAYEAEGLVGLVSNSPFLGWSYSLLSVRSFSSLLGVLELAIAALIAARLLHPIYSLAGGLLSAGLFATTLSFMVTTPGVWAPDLGFPAISVAPGQFLLKDVGLFALSLFIALDSLRALRSPRA